MTLPGIPSPSAPEVWRTGLAAAGLLLAFRGWSAFRLGLALTGFLLGSGAVLHAAPHFPREPRWLLPAAVAAAGLVAALFVLLAWRIGLSLLGAAAFLLTALSVPQFLPPAGPARWLTLALVALAGAFVARFLEKPAISIATALVGAALVTAAAAGPVRPWRIPAGPSPSELVEEPWLLVLFVLVALVGAVVQLRQDSGERD